MKPVAILPLLALAAPIVLTQQFTPSTVAPKPAKLLDEILTFGEGLVKHDEGILNQLDKKLEEILKCCRENSSAKQDKCFTQLPTTSTPRPPDIVHPSSMKPEPAPWPTKHGQLTSSSTARPRKKIVMVMAQRNCIRCPCLPVRCPVPAGRCPCLVIPLIYEPCPPVIGTTTSLATTTTLEQTTKSPIPTSSPQTPKVPTTAAKTSESSSATEAVPKGESHSYGNPSVKDPFYSIIQPPSLSFHAPRDDESDFALRRKRQIRAERDQNDDIPQWDANRRIAFELFEDDKEVIEDLRRRGYEIHRDHAEIPESAPSNHQQNFPTFLCQLTPNLFLCRPNTPESVITSNPPRITSPSIKPTTTEETTTRTPEMKETTAQNAPCSMSDRTEMSCLSFFVPLLCLTVRNL